MSKVGSIEAEDRVLKKIFFNFYGFSVKLEIESERVAELLKKDFSHFESKAPGDRCNLSISAKVSVSIYTSPSNAICHTADIPPLSIIASEIAIW